VSKGRRGLGEATVTALTFAGASECLNALDDVDATIYIEALVLSDISTLLIIGDFEATGVSSSCVGLSHIEDFGG
jgi:hypothetical protein